MKGLTGVIKFDHQGFRSDFTLDIIELTREGLQKAGSWNSSEGVNYTRSYGDNQKQIVEILQNKTLIVTTILVSSTFELLKNPTQVGCIRKINKLYMNILPFESELGNNNTYKTKLHQSIFLFQFRISF